jgi:hypothetical protein
LSVAIREVDKGGGVVGGEGELPDQDAAIPGGASSHFAFFIFNRIDIKNK